MIKYFILTLLFLFTITQANAQVVIREGVRYWIGKENGNEFIFRDPIDSNYPVNKVLIYKAPTDRKYFHWTNKEYAQNWLENKVTDAQFMAIRRNGITEGAGGGFYISKDPFSSAMCGESGLSVALNEGVRLAEVSKNFFSGHLNKQEKSEIIEDLGLDGWDYNPSQGWINVFKLNAIKSIESMKFEHFSGFIKTSKVWTFPEVERKNYLS